MRAAEFCAQLFWLPSFPSFVSFCTFQIVKCRLRRRERHLRPPFSPSLLQSGKQTPLGMESLWTESQSTLFHSILFSLSFSPQRDPSLAVGVKKSSRRLVSCQNNTSRHRERERERERERLLSASLCQSLRSDCCGSPPSFPCRKP